MEVTYIETVFLHGISPTGGRPSAAGQAAAPLFPVPALPGWGVFLLSPRHQHLPGGGVLGDSFVATAEDRAGGGSEIR